MDLRAVRAFLVVAEELNFRRSAERLHMSQPPLTRMIAALERDLRTRLFVRNTKRVALTPAGERLLREAPSLLRKFEALETKLRKFDSRSAPSIRVGVSYSGFQSWVPEALARYGKSKSGVPVDVANGESSLLLRDLRKKKFDLICIDVEEELPEGFGSLLVSDVPVGVLVPKTHLLAKRKSIRFVELEGETFIVHPRRDHAHVAHSHECVFRNSGIRYRTYTRKSGEHCPILVAQGKGVSLTGEIYARHATANTRFVPIRDPGLRLRTALVWNTAETEPGLDGLLAFLRRSRR